MAAWTGREAFQFSLCHVSSPIFPQSAILNALQPYFEGTPFSKHAVEGVVAKVLADEFVTTTQISLPPSERQLFRKLASTLSTRLKNIEPDEFDKAQDIHGALSDVNNKARLILSQKGLEIDSVKYHIVEQLPAPYAERPFSALTADFGDKELFGIEEGVYFVSKKLRPLFTPMLYLHELVHVMLSESAPLELARGLEEGICELVGMFYLAPQIFGKTVYLTAYLSSRVDSLNNRMLNSYRDFLRQALPVLTKCGWVGVLELVRRGRCAIKEVETLLWSGQFLSHLDDLQLPVGDFSNLDDVVFATNVISQELHCSPDALWVAYHTRRGMTVQEIAVLSKLDFEITQRALRELEDPVRYVSLSEDGLTVTFSDCERLHYPYMLRALLLDT